MHGAHNLAYRHIDTELAVCIDSDDYMPDDAVESILSFWDGVKNKEKYAGFMGLDITEDGKVIGTSFNEDYQEVEMLDYYEKGGAGDKKMVYRTEVVKQYPEYPIFEGEKYVGLTYKDILINKDYKYLTFNKPLVVVEYQPDGSSMNMFRQYWKNPKGFAFYRLHEMQMAKSLKRRFMVNIHYVSSSIRAKDRCFIRKSPQKTLTISAIPFGIILYCLIRYKNRAKKA